MSVPEGEIATVWEMIDTAKANHIFKGTRREALLIVVILTDGTEISYREDNGMFHSRKSSE